MEACVYSRKKLSAVGGACLSVLVHTILNFISLEKGIKMYLILIGPQP